MSSKILPTQGNFVQYQGRIYRISSELDLTSVLAKECESGIVRKLPISELEVMSSDDQKPKKVTDIELAGVTSKEWEVARGRYEAIRPLLKVKRTIEEINKQAELSGVNRATIYRWLSAYESMRRVSALLPNKRGRQSQTGTFDDAVEVIINSCIDEFYLTIQRPSVRKVNDEVAKRCRNSGVKTPHLNTVRNRIQWINERSKTKKKNW